MKKIALSNASNQGIENGIPGDEIIHIKANKLWKKVFEFQTRFIGRHNNSVDITDIFFTTRWAEIFLIPHNPNPVSLLNSNPNGALENVPGSYLDSNQDVFDGILEELKKEKTKIKIQSCKPNHTFMPVISTLAFNNTDVDWSQALNDRNLVCTGEIPFAAYFIDGINNPHITITEANYTWLEYQFVHGDAGCDPVCGTFSITGDQNICDGNMNTIHTYTFNGGIGTGQILDWTVTGDLIIENSIGNTVGIKIITSVGSGIIKGTLTNGCGDKIERSYTVLIGKSDISLSADFEESSCAFEITINLVPADKTPLSYEWSTNGTSYTSGDKTKNFFMPAHYTSKQVYARANWGCGYTFDDIMLEFPEVTDCDDNWPAPVTIHKESNTKEVLMLTPNPTTHGWQLSIPERLSDNYEITLTDGNNKLIRTYKSTSTQKVLIIEGEALKPGMYFLKIISKTNQFSLRAIKV